MKTVFVASSRKYYADVREIKGRLDSAGVKGFYPYFDMPDEKITDEEKKKITMRHFPELDECDAIYVYAKDGYVGYSVTIEVAYAYAKGKEVYSSEPIKELAVQAMVSRVMTPAEFVEYASKS